MTEKLIMFLLVCGWLTALSLSFIFDNIEEVCEWREVLFTEGD